VPHRRPVRCVCPDALRLGEFAPSGADRQHLRQALATLDVLTQRELTSADEEVDGRRVGERLVKVRAKMKTPERGAQL
jgi:hypothetical protein